MRQTYSEFRERQQQEFNDFPIAYAFNDQQLADALEKLGVESIKECVTVFGHGDIVRKEDAPRPNFYVRTSYRRTSRSA